MKVNCEYKIQNYDFKCSPPEEIILFALDEDDKKKVDITMHDVSFKVDLDDLEMIVKLIRAQQSVK